MGNAYGGWREEQVSSGQSLPVGMDRKQWAVSIEGLGPLTVKGGWAMGNEGGEGGAGGC